MTLAYFSPHPPHPPSPLTLTPPLTLHSPSSAITDCLPISAGEHVFVHGDSTSFGSSISFTCESGYKLQGAPSIICRSDGTWSADVPTCINTGVHCSPLTLAENVKGSTTETVNGTEVFFACPEGFILHGPQMMICQNNGSWSPDNSPYCAKPVEECPALTFKPHVHSSSSNVTYGSKVSFSCDDGYKLIGQTTIECLPTGNWSAPLPSCKPVNCSAINIGDHVHSDSSSTTYGSKVTFSCDDGYELNGQATIVCLPTGNWSATFPSCSTASALQNGGGGGEYTPVTINVGMVVSGRDGVCVDINIILCFWMQ